MLLQYSDVTFNPFSDVTFSGIKDLAQDQLRAINPVRVSPDEVRASLKHFWAEGLKLA